MLRVGAPPADVGGAAGAAAAHRATGVGARSTQVADVSEVDGPVQVTRIDGEPQRDGHGTATGSDLGAVTADLTEAARRARRCRPARRYAIGGVSAEQADAFGDLGLAVLAAIAIVFMIMVATFRSLIQPLILLVSIPFAATGAIGLLLATGTAARRAGADRRADAGRHRGHQRDRADRPDQPVPAQGMGVQEAVIEGGRRRLRPILMTAIATIFALLPMALGLTGEGGFISQPLAIVVIGGLISSTLLTLVLVPTLYTMVENRKEKSGPARLRRPQGRRLGRTRRGRRRSGRARGRRAGRASGAGADARCRSSRRRDEAPATGPAERCAARLHRPVRGAASCRRQPPDRADRA